MSNVTQILSAINQGDVASAEKLFPLVYEELRRLATVRLANEIPGNTLQPTALVHEAYVRLVDTENPTAWNSRGHFFAAAAEAMRRILIESARRRRSVRRGGDLRRQPLNEFTMPAELADEQLLALDEALTALKLEQPVIGRLVELRYFGGLTIDETAAALDLSSRSANRYWTYAKAWLSARI